MNKVLNVPPWRSALRLGLLAACLVSGAALAQSPATDLGSSLEGLLAHARAQSPELRMASLEAEAARERILPAGALPDPAFRLELENITANGNSALNLAPNKVGATKYTLMQSLPLWGKRGLREDVARAEAQQLDGQVASTWATLSTEIKKAYAQYWQSTRMAQLARDILGVITRMERTAEVRYASGLATQQEVIRTQLERTALQSELLMLDNERAQMQAMINGLLAREHDAPLADPVSPPAGLRNYTAGSTDFAELAQRLQARNPQLLIEAARIDAAEKNEALTQRNRYPDLTVGVSPMQSGNRIESWSLMFEVMIPLQQGVRRSQEREARLMVDAAQARRAAAGQRLMGELSGAVTALNTARSTEALTSTRLLPQAELNYQSALASYESGKLDFATVLEAQRQVRMARQTMISTQATQQLRLADIERLLGEE